MILVKANLPCKDCTERAVGCHSTCKKYLEQKECYDQAREKRNEEVNQAALLYEHKQQAMENMRKRTNAWKWRKR